MLFFIINSLEITDIYPLGIGDESCSTRKKINDPMFLSPSPSFLSRYLEYKTLREERITTHKAFCTPLFWRLLIGFNAFYIELCSELWILYEKGTYSWIDFFIEIIPFINSIFTSSAFIMIILTVGLFKVCLSTRYALENERIHFLSLSLFCSYTRRCLE